LKPLLLEAPPLHAPHVPFGEELVHCQAPEPDDDGDGPGLVLVLVGDGLVAVGDGPVLLAVGDGDGLVTVGEGDGLVAVGEGDGLVAVGEADGNGPSDGPAHSTRYVPAGQAGGWLTDTLLNPRRPCACAQAYTVTAARPSAVGEADGDGPSDGPAHSTRCVPAGQAGGWLTDTLVNPRGLCAFAQAYTVTAAGPAAGCARCAADSRG
jgi:hypothetical protein